MADGTKIEWTEATWNPITGCSLASPGCTNCYAMDLAGTRLADHPSRKGLTQPSKAGRVWTGEVRFNEHWLDQPLRWKKPRMIFVCAHGDLFHESVPDEWIDRVFAVMALCPQHTFQVLTKRSARMREWFSRGRDETIWEAVASLVDDWSDGRFPGVRLPVFDGDPILPALAAHGAVWGGQRPWPLRNVWLGVSVEDQQRADERIPDLLATPAAVRWISAEPLLGSVDLRWIAQPDDERDGVIDALLGCDWVQRDGNDFEPVRPGHEGRKMGRWVCSSEADILANRKIDWVVVGGESGPGARPMHPDWARSLRDQCAAADVPFFFKQWGEHFPCELLPDQGDGTPWRTMHEGPPAWALSEYGKDRADLDQVSFARVGKKHAGRLLDGIEHNGMPGGAA